MAMKYLEHIYTKKKCLLFLSNSDLTGLPASLFTKSVTPPWHQLRNFRSAES